MRILLGIEVMLNSLLSLFSVSSYVFVQFHSRLIHVVMALFDTFIDFLLLYVCKDIWKKALMNSRDDETQHSSRRFFSIE